MHDHTVAHREQHRKGDAHVVLGVNQRTQQPIGQRQPTPTANRLRRVEDDGSGQRAQAIEQDRLARARHAADHHERPRAEGEAAILEIGGHRTGMVLGDPERCLRTRPRYHAESCAGLQRLCGRRDSNPHALRHRLLRPACLPIPPRPRVAPAGPAGRSYGRRAVRGRVLRRSALPCPPRPGGGMADADASKASARKGVWVRVPPRALTLSFQREEGGRRAANPPACPSS